MSRRRLNIDAGQARRDAMRREMTVEDQLAAIWDALDKLEAEGADIGDQARGALTAVRRIKRAIPDRPARKE